MSSGAHSGVSNGTVGTQGSLDQMNLEIATAHNEEATKHLNYLHNELPKGSPIHIPSSASVVEEHKNGYDQVKYTWHEGEYIYV